MTKLRVLAFFHFERRSCFEPNTVLVKPPRNIFPTGPSQEALTLSIAGLDASASAQKDTFVRSTILSAAFAEFVRIYIRTPPEEKHG